MGWSALFFLFFLPFGLSGQVSDGETLDRIVAVVGGEVVLKSDIDRQKGQEQQQMVQGGMDAEGNSDCELVENLMYRKLLLHQSKVDSITVSESRVDSEMDRRIRYFVQQIGSQEKLEEFYGMSVDRIREEFRPGIKEQMRIQRMRQDITKDISVTPSEVKEYYQKLPEDSIPLIEASVRIAHIVKKPEVGEKAIESTRQRLMKFKERIQNGEKSFSVLATLYSDDPGSAGNGGDLGFIERGEMVQEFEAAIFDMEEGELSDIIRTEHGFHLAQVQEKRGQKVKARHILLKPKVESSELDRVKGELKEIAERVRLEDTLSFEKAAERFSDDEKSQKSGGLVVNRQSGSSTFKMEDLDPQITFAIENLKVGEVSKPVRYDTEEGRAYRIIKLLERTEPHRATLERDYRHLQERAKKAKEDREMREWVNERIRETYIRVGEAYRSCEFKHEWLNDGQASSAPSQQ